NLKSALEDLPTHGVRVNEIRFVARDSSEADVAGKLTASALGGMAGQLGSWLKDPRKLLQLISAASGTKGGGEPGLAPATGGSGVTASSGDAPGIGSVVSGSDAAALAPLKEEDVLGVIHFLNQIGNKNQEQAPADPAFVQRALGEMPVNAHDLLYQALFKASAASFEGDQEASDLVKLAEHLAIRFAVESFERGDVKINAVQQMIERLSKELDSLRGILNEHEERMGKLGMLVETHADILDRQFWAAVPEWGKKKVLLAADCWCIPPRNVRSYVESLIERKDEELAFRILQHYSTAIDNSDADARRKAATGLSELADLYGRMESHLLQSILMRLGRQLTLDFSEESQTLMSAAFVRLSQEAASRKDFVAVEQSLATLARIEQRNPQAAREVRPRIAVEIRLREFISEVSRNPLLPAGLLDVLKRTPHKSAEEIAVQFGQCSRREEANRYVALLMQVGPGALEHLRDVMRTRSASEAILTTGLLSCLDLPMLVSELPDRIRQWNRQQQDAAMRQIACAGVEERGELILAMLDNLDPLILPQAVDDIGMTHSYMAAGKLLDLAAGQGSRTATPYLQVKAVEALGRLRVGGAEQMLANFVSERHLLTWKHPRELRIAAAQALQRVNPERAVHLVTKGGISAEELKIGPLDPVHSNGWVRQRRYQRVSPEVAIHGTATTNRGVYDVTLEKLSLGGGMGSRTGRTTLGSDAVLDINLGLRRVHSRVLVREAPSGGVSFEIADIALDDRSKLRKLVHDQMVLSQAAAASRIAAS
ncbi:MAG TPA: hypothetical protein VK473_08780, partial [Terriglobales bacterium]|nr:hypothetical protein [Terriglobales bacterium]